MTKLRSPQSFAAFRVGESGPHRFHSLEAMPLLLIAASPEDVQSHKEVGTLVALVPIVPIVPIVPMMGVSQQTFTKSTLLRVSASFSIYLPSTSQIRNDQTRRFGRPTAKCGAFGGSSLQHFTTAFCAGGPYIISMSAISGGSHVPSQLVLSCQNL